MNPFTVTLNFPPTVDPTGFELMGIKAYMKTTSKSTKIHEGEITLIFDGYIHNLCTLRRNMISCIDDDKNTCGEQSKYSIIIDIYREYGIEYLLQVLDGTFTFVLLDQRLTMDDSKMYIVSDPMGVRPLYNIVEPGANFDTGNTYTFTTENPSNAISSSVSSANYVCPHRDLRSPNGHSTIPSACYQFTLENRVRSYWTLEETITYSLPGKSGGFPRIMYHPDSKTAAITPDFEEFVKIMTEYHLSCAVEKYLSVYPEKTTIFCIVSHDDYESQMIANLATRISMKGMNPDEEAPNINIPPVAKQPDEYYEGSLNIVKISIDMFVKENTYSDDLLQHFIRDSCDRYLQTHTTSYSGNHHIWMSSGLLNREKQIKRTCKNIMDYDHKYRDYLNRIGTDHLIPNIIEPCKKVGLEVTFPFLEPSWIQYYLSIHPLYRYTTSIVENQS